MRNRPIPVPKARRLGEVQVVMGFAGFFALMYGASGIVALFSRLSSDRAVALPIVLMGLLSAWTFVGLIRGRIWGWVLGILTFGLLLLLSLAGLAIASYAQFRGTADSSFAGSGVALFASMILGLLFATPLYLLVRCRRKYYSIAPKA